MLANYLHTLGNGRRTLVGSAHHGSRMSLLDFRTAIIEQELWVRVLAHRWAD